jgi:PKD repeat protein
LTVTDEKGLTGSASMDVTIVNNAPVAMIAPPVVTYFTVDVDGSGSYDPDAPHGMIMSYDWTFGDGGTASGPTASHTYALAGTYTVTLTVTDDKGLIGVAVASVEIINLAPVSTIAPPVVTHLDVSVDSAGSYDPDGWIASYSWDFGDGTILTGALASHTYLTKGIKTITLTVTDNMGLTGTASVQVTLVDDPPVASFTVSVVDDTVYVDASGSSDDYEIVDYSWNWGDGTTGSGMTASHKYGTTVMSSVDKARQPPPFPYPVFGYVYDVDGVTPVDGAAVHVTDSLSGLVYDLVTEYGGFWQIDIGEKGFYDGTTVNVTVTFGTLIGWNEQIAWQSAYFLQMDVVLHSAGPVVEPHDVTITLTVMDALGQTGTMQVIATVYW